MKEYQIGENFLKSQRQLSVQRNQKRKLELLQLKWKSGQHPQQKWKIKASLWELLMIIKKLGNDFN